MIEVELPDGTIVEFPDGTDNETIERALAQLVGSRTRTYDPFASDERSLPPLPGENVQSVEPDVRERPSYLQGIRQALSQPGDVNPLTQLYGLAEAGTSLASGIAAPVLASARGILTGQEPTAEDIARFTYQPTTATGQNILNVAGAVLDPVARAAEATGADVALLPLAVQTQSLSTLRRAPKPDPVPTTEQLRSAKEALYRRAEEAGVVIKPEATAASARIFRDVAERENLGRLPGKLSEAVSILEERVSKNRPLTLSDADKVRQLINDALASNDAADRRLARIIKGRYDAYLDSLGPQDVLAGDATQAVSFLRAARDAHRRFENSRLLDTLEQRAERAGDAKFTQAGAEHALRTEFRKLADSERRMRPFTPEQREAIEAVARGGATGSRRAVANALRNLGKFDPTSGGMAAFLGPATGTTIGLAAGGPSGAGVGSLLGLALPVAGAISSRASTRLTRGNVERARESLVGRGLPRVPNSEEVAAMRARASQTAPEPMTGDVVPPQPLALPAPEIIAGTRSAPGTAFAREELGLTPDVERAGALHPGAARASLMPRTQALPNLPPRPMVVDPSGRAAPSQGVLDAYLHELGLLGTAGVRQPSATPVSRGLLSPEPPVEEVASGLLGATRSVEEIRRDLRRVDSRMQRLPVDEPLDSPRMMALAREWERLRAELELAESRAASL